LSNYTAHEQILGFGFLFNIELPKSLYARDLSNIMLDRTILFEKLRSY